MHCAPKPLHGDPRDVRTALRNAPIVPLFLSSPGLVALWTHSADGAPEGTAGSSWHQAVSVLPSETSDANCSTGVGCFSPSDWCPVSCYLCYPSFLCFFSSLIASPDTWHCTPEAAPT